MKKSKHKNLVESFFSLIENGELSRTEWISLVRLLEAKVDDRDQNVIDLISALKKFQKMKNRQQKTQSVINAVNHFISMTIAEYFAKVTRGY